MTTTVEVKPQADFWQRMCRTRPLRALSELVWNSLDADAGDISVRFEKNPLGGIQRISVVDTGCGIPSNGQTHEFSSLGGSWKARQNRTRKEKRLLHGKNGEGRFRAFALGERVKWETVAEINGKLVSHEVFGSTLQPGRFEIEDAVELSKGHTGTTVTIENLTPEIDSALLAPSFRDDFARIFAPYLNKYRSIKLTVDSQSINTDNLIACSVEYRLGPFRLTDGSEVSATLEIIEWKSISGRALYLCDEGGFALAERAPEIRAPGFHFGAYLRSKYFQDLDEGNLVDLDIGEGITVLLGHARIKLAEYFRKREREIAASLIQRWKEEAVYPYKEEPKTPTQKNAQRVFNMCAYTIHTYISGFEDQDRTAKALSFRLLREAIEGSPSEVARILNEVLKLPKKKQEELSYLLERTKLSDIIDMAKEIDSRINVCVGLRGMVCSDDLRDSVKEREHIHKIVERNPWLFGETYALAQSEAGLTKVLRAHLRKLHRDERMLVPVLRSGGRAGRVDLMLAKRVKRSGRDDDQHLIVELKRANKILGAADLQQLLSYANAVMRDSRFDKTAVQWHFWLVGVSLDEDIEEQSNSADREAGCVHIFKNGRGSVWVKTWGQLLHDCLSRLEFVRSRLNLEATEDDAIEFLEKLYPEYVPETPEAA